MNKGYIIAALLTVAGIAAEAQVRNAFRNVYPIGDNPNISYMTTMTDKETILFDANPVVRYSFYNNFYTRYQKLKSADISHSHGQAVYLSFRPQLRMYTDNSVPVKMPSYRILFGTQQMWRVRDSNLFAFSFESGHYSNGQYGCTYAENADDATAACDSVYNTITSGTDLSEMLNRRNGEFSTNLTEVIVNYRINTLLKNKTPYKIHSISAGFTLYHDKMLGFLPFGGYSDHDLEIYGRYRTSISYEYSVILSKPFKITFVHRSYRKPFTLLASESRVSALFRIERIHRPHKSVHPWRAEATFSCFFVNDFGIYIRFIYGHDNYNVRFVDSGKQFSAGFTWNMFPSFKIMNNISG